MCSSMRIFVLLYLALLTSPKIVNARYTTLPDNTSEQETTPVTDTTEPMSRDPECATGEDGAAALADAFHLVAKAFLRVQEALRLQEQQAGRRVQDALRLNEQKATTALRDAVRQMEYQLQERDGAIRALRHTVQHTLRLQEQEAERRIQEALRLHEEKAATALQDAVRQMEHRLQDRDETVRALRNGMSERIQRVEKRLQELVVQPNFSATQDRDAADQGQLFIDQLEKRMMNLESTVKTVQDQLRLGTPMGQMADPSSAGEPHASPSTFIPSTSISSVFISSANISASTTPQPPIDSTLRARQYPDITLNRQSTESTTEEPVDVEREKKWLDIRLRKARARRDRARSTPSPPGEALCTAVFDGRVADVRRLLDSGADVNYTSSHGTTPLTAAFYLPFQWHNANPDVLSLLLERGADVNAVDTNGWSALHYAAEYDVNGSCVAVLLGAGANVNARDEDGATPLHRVLGLWYLWSENEVTARALLAAGANKSLRCWGGRWRNMTPFDVAESVSADDASSRDLLRLLRP